MKKVSHDRINAARELLGLGETATIREIRAAYKQLARSRHPDAGGTDAEMKRINEARALLLRYCEEFPVSFRREDSGGQDEEYDQWVERFFGNFFL